MDMKEEWMLCFLQAKKAMELQEEASGMMHLFMNTLEELCGSDVEE